MEKWWTCRYACGNCTLDIYDERVKYIDPTSILEWAHDVIDLIEHSFIHYEGIPLKYYITCSHEATLSNFITPKDNNEYIKSNKYKSDIIQQVSFNISHAMIHYSVIRKQWLNSDSYNSLTLSIHEIHSFRERMMNVNKLSQVRKMLNQIPITTSFPYTRVHRQIRQRYTFSKPI